MDPNYFFICRSDGSSSANYGDLWRCIIIFLLNLVFQTFAVCFQVLPFLGRPSCVRFTSSHLFSMALFRGVPAQSPLSSDFRKLPKSSGNLIFLEPQVVEIPLLVEIFSLGPPPPWHSHLQSFFLLSTEARGIRSSQPVHAVTLFHLFQVESLNGEGLQGLLSPAPLARPEPMKWGSPTKPAGLVQMPPWKAVRGAVAKEQGRAVGRSGAKARAGWEDACARWGRGNAISPPGSRAMDSNPAMGVTGDHAAGCTEGFFFP